MLDVAWQPFNLVQPWRTSALEDDIPASHVHLQFDTLESIAEASTDLLINIPDLTPDLVGTTVTAEPTQVFTADAAQSRPTVDLDSDFWDPSDGETSITKQKTLFTWEDFGNAPRANGDVKSYASDQPWTDFNDLQPHIGTLPQDVMLRALCSLILGRVSTFYQWDAQKEIFAPTLRNAAILGLSAGLTESLQADALKHGKIVRRLRQGAAVQYKSSPAKTAFGAAMRDTVDAVETWVAVEVASVCTLLQFDSLLSRSLPLLAVCWQFHVKVNEQVSDEASISLLKNHTESLAATDDQYHPLFSRLLRIVLQPWFDQVTSRIGLSRPEQHVQSTNSDLLTDEAMAAIVTIERGRSILQDHSPDHPLCLPVTTSISLTRDTLDVVLSKATQLENDLRHSIERFHAGQLVPEEQSNAQITSNPTWSAFSMTSIEDMCHLHEDPANLSTDGLQQLVSRLLDLDSEQGPLVDMKTFFHDPLEYLQPLLRMQSRLVHNATLRLMFKQYRVLEIFELHRKTFMFADAGFTQRLREAFFEDRLDNQDGKVTTYRQRTGLQLNARHAIKWPPTSSELSLNLLGILSDTTISNDLSFAVRELHEEEIERVCDPSSVHALDFIRLQYESSSPLDQIFGPEAARCYDEIFSTLLLHTRMLHYTSSLCYDMLKNSNDHIGCHARLQACTIRRMHRTVSVLANHATQRAILEPWHHFQRVLKACANSCSPDLDETGAYEVPPPNNDLTDIAGLYSLEDLQQEHMQYLGLIRRHLFIGRKHEGIRKAYTTIYTLILQCLNHTDDLPRLNMLLDSAEQQLMQELETMMDKLSRIHGNDNDVEADLISVLLASSQ